ncbi:hypothetical protein [Streptomyces sp. H27-S2]|uniref:hypothetical protein n=1 Tax=Streptomyces antarcticus TaxID=2996458 RepID=UPI002271A09F|nr:hypothetical protein [Streptomyces sp. H27-S2]MCY0954096.1 hypothetical protein [Streptomyces sp. H27-S2]
MWSAEDVARDSVRRQGDGLTGVVVAERVAEAAVRERETERALLGGAFSEYGSEPERLAVVWAAKHREWQRVSLMMDTSGWDAYEPERDVQGSVWERERDERRQGVLSGHAAQLARRQDERDELRTELWLSAGSSRLIRAAAARAGLRPVEVLAQLAERVVVGEDGTVSVPPFSPSL